MGIIADKAFALAEEMEKGRLAFEKRCQEKEKNIEELLKILGNKKTGKELDDETIQLEVDHSS